MTENNDLFDSSPDDNSDLFTDDGNAPVEDKDYYAELVGDGKKFKDEKALAKAKIHSDQHIARVEKENAELRQELNQRLTLEEFYEKVKSSQPSPSSHTEPTEDDRERNEISLEQIGSLVDQRVQKLTEAERASERQRQNLEYVKSEMHKRLGPGFQKLLRDRAAELGETEQDLTLIAMHKPKVFLDLMTPRKQESPTPSLPHTEVNVAGTTTLDGKVRNQSWYSQLKKTDPEKYKSPKVQAQMHKDALALGEKFFQ